MFKSIAPTVIEDIRQRSDIVDIVGRYVTLKRSGQNYKGPCPFHQEKTPSFMVNPARQIYKCFGCGAGGNVITFLMQYNQLSFPEVLRDLAGQYGIHLDFDEVDEEAESQKTIIKKINLAACSFFEAQLQDPEKGKEGQDYLRQRGISEEMQKRFRLGFSLNQWHALEHHLKRQGFQKDDLLASGLFRSPEGKDGIYDLFRDRLMFPILSAIDEVVGFGGRLMSQEKQAKYINSPETLVYQKGHHVYGLNLAKKVIRDKDRVLLAEGYLDVITAHQFGFSETVAALGTALTPQQARLILRYTEHKHVYMAYDADQAGQKATQRGAEVLDELKLQARIKVLALPESMDPDTFLQNFGAESFQAQIDIAQPVFEYQVENIIEEYQLHDSVQKADAAKACVELLLKIKEPVYRDECLQYSAKLLGVELGILREQMIMTSKKMRRYHKNKKPSHHSKAQQNTSLAIEDPSKNKMVASEMGLIFLVLNYPQKRDEILGVFRESRFSNAYNEDLRKDILALEEVKPIENAYQLLDRYTEPVMHQHLIRILENEVFTQVVEENKTSVYEKLLADFMINVRLQCLSVKLEQLNQDIKEAELTHNREQYSELMQAYMIAVKDLNDLKGKKL